MDEVSNMSSKQVRMHGESLSQPQTNKNCEHSEFLVQVMLSCDRRVLVSSMVQTVEHCCPMESKLQAAVPAFGRQR